MQTVPFSTTYYLDVALMRAGEAAEILWCRARAWCGDQETDGVVPREILPRLVTTRAAARARALVEAGLWVEVPAGWQFVRWDAITRDQLDDKREAGRIRQQRHRAKNRNGVTDGVSNAVTNGEVTGEREREKERTAAAAAVGAPLDPTVDVLRAKLQAHTRLQALRFDTLTPEAADQLVDLVAVHGDDRLVQVALDTCRATPPVHVSAFLGTWAALPTPGQRLRAVPPSRCTTHDTQRTPAGVCTSCAAEDLAGGDR